jgi:hypothetical protein
VILSLNVHPGWILCLRNKVDTLPEKGWSINLRNDTINRSIIEHLI